MSRLIAVSILLSMIATGCGFNSSPAKILVFSKTAGYRHESIAAGKTALLHLGVEKNIQVDTTEDASVFTTSKLREYAAIVFLNTTQDCLDEHQQIEMMRYIQAGGGFVGIHAAADTEYDWPWYGGLVGAYFNGHPNNPNVRDAIVERVAHEHPACQHLPEKWHRTDEWYNYRDIQPDLHILLNLDEDSYEGGTNGANHPIAWYHEYDGGRAFYTGGGHTNETFSEEPFMQHLWEGIRYAMGSGSELDYARSTIAPEENRFQKVVLDDNLNEPMELEMLPDRRILFIERKGDIKLYDPQSKSTSVISHLKVHSKHEDGLLGLALDPNFAENHWLYLFYSPPGDEPKQHISRFDFIDDKVDFSTEKVLLEIGTQRDECCHSAGCLEFGPDGNLWISAGDDTNPFESGGFSPSDERPGRSPWDAQKSSSNTNDLRGKISRITPQPDGSYTIPDGNLFPKDGSLGRPEIYAMGCRNPYRIAIDQHTGYLYWGDVGPDAGKDSTGRGPKGHDEVNQAKAAGFFGWPYFVADNKAYTEYDFATKTSGQVHDPARPINNSPNNTGVQELPPAQPAFIWYPYDESKEFPLVGEGGRNAMAGPVFYVDDYPENDARFPAYFDGKLFTYDWIRGWMMTVTMDSLGNLVRMERFLPSTKFSNPNDIIMGPDGDIYMLEYGTAWFSQNKDARLVHLKYLRGNRTPLAKLTASITEGSTPLDVSFSAADSDDPDGDVLAFTWSIADNDVKLRGESVSHRFEEPGEYLVTLEAKDGDGLTSLDQVMIQVGNDPPSLTLDVMGNSTFFFPGSDLAYAVGVRDKEDGQLGAGIAAEDVALTINYLEKGADINVISMGHEALAASAKFMIGQQNIEKSDCAACHFKDKESVGPAYLEIAKKYADEDGARTYLIDKVLNGGGGVWGVQAMAAHPQHTEEEAGTMIDYILSLKDTDQQSLQRLPLAGSYHFDASTEGNVEGSYIVMASYTDKGAEGAAPITRRAALTLAYPALMAADCDVLEVASRMDVSAERLAPIGINEDRTIVIANHQGVLGFKNIDLTDIAAIELGVILSPEYTHGGVISLHIDDAASEPIATLLLEMKPENLGLHYHSLAIEGQAGKKDLYFKIQGNEEKLLGTLLDLRFNTVSDL